MEFFIRRRKCCPEQLNGGTFWVILFQRRTLLCLFSPPRHYFARFQLMMDNDVVTPYYGDSIFYFVLCYVAVSH